MSIRLTIIIFSYIYLSYWVGLGTVYMSKLCASLYSSLEAAPLQSRHMIYFILVNGIKCTWVLGLSFQIASFQRNTCRLRGQYYIGKYINCCLPHKRSGNMYLAETSQVFLLCITDTFGVRIQSKAKLISTTTITRRTLT